jgi:F-type H+/Na+-transporting ATPase subunit alpha
MPNQDPTLPSVLDQTFSLFGKVLGDHRSELNVHEVGRIRSVEQGIARVLGLPGVQTEELLEFSGGCIGLAFNVSKTEVGVILLDAGDQLTANGEVRRTNRVLEVPVGDALLGRVVDALGRPLDNRGSIRSNTRRAVEQEAPSIKDRAPVTVPLQTGIKVIDALIPIGRGQRELILGDRQSGKTAIALDTILNQRGQDIICVYCAIGQQSSAVAKVITELQTRGAMDYCTVIVATGDDPPGLQYIAPYAAMTMAEHFMRQGRDTLVVFDDLTRHAWAYRQLSLLLRRPPGREAFPGDIFYIHSRLLERSTHLRDELGGGSLTALPIIETEAQNLSAYIPTNLISITDGQIYLSPDLFQKGMLPPVEVGKSVSRVGGKTQLGAYRAVAGDLRLSYSQFEELETFSRFGTRLDEETRKTIEHGRRVREILKQSQFQPLSVPEQLMSLVAVNQRLFDQLPLSVLRETEHTMHNLLKEQAPELCDHILNGQRLTTDQLDVLVNIAHSSIETTSTGR